MHIELVSHTTPDNLIGRRSEPMVLDILTFELDLLGQQALLLDIHMEEVLYAGIDRSCNAVGWMNSSFPADRLIKRYFLSLSDFFQYCCLVRW